MLDEMFMRVLDMSKTASVVILVVLAARLLLKKAPKVFSYALWGVALFRLLCPVALEAPVSVLPEMEPVAQGYALAEEPISFSGAVDGFQSALADALNGGLGIQHIPTTETADGRTRYVTSDWYDVWVLLGQYLWLAGMAVMLARSGVSYWKLRKKLAVAAILEGNILVADDVEAPFVVGLLRPKIYIPCGLGEREREYIIRHERYHIKRLDHAAKAAGFAALCVHWFNPLVWLAFVLANKDMEMSCDEAVVKQMGEGVRADYSASLLTFATGRRIIGGTPLAFGEGDPKGRIEHLARWKKPALGVVLIAAAVCAILAVCLLTDPVRGDELREDRYYLRIGTEGVTYIEISSPGAGGGCANADGSPFKLGDEVWLEPLDGVTSLRGVSVTARDGQGDYLYSFSVPESATNSEIKRILAGDNWLIAPEPEDGYYLRIGAEGVTEILVSAPGAGGGCANADGSPFKLGDEVWLEPLDGVTSLRGVSITARDEYRRILYAFSVPEHAAYSVIQSILDNDRWLIPPAGAVMIPTAANLSGPFDQYLYLSMWGDTYRYERMEGEADVTTDALLGGFTEEASPKDVHWIVYSVHEYYDRSVVLAVTDTGSERLYRYSPPKAVEPDALERAREAGCVIMENGDVTAGEGRWEKFLQASSAGKSASVRVASYHTLDPERCHYEYYEAYREDYPALHILELTYDGGRYTLRWTEEGTEHTREYRYLMRFVGDTVDELDFNEQYVLTNDADVTWEQLVSGVVSSQFGDYIDFHPIYTDLK